MEPETILNSLSKRALDKIFCGMTTTFLELLSNRMMRGMQFPVAQGLRLVFMSCTNMTTDRLGHP